MSLCPFLLKYISIVSLIAVAVVEPNDSFYHFRFISVFASVICESISFAAAGQSSNASTPKIKRDNKYIPNTMIANIGANVMTMSASCGMPSVVVVVLESLFLFVKQYSHVAINAIPYDKNT